MRIRSEERESGARNENLGRGTKYPTTLCAHGGTSDPLSRCIIKSKCVGNDTFGDQKSCDTLISQ